MPVAKLTDRKIKGLKPGPKTVEYRDAAVKGLSVRITPAGCRTFSVSYRRREDGKQKRLTLGKFGILTYEDAKVRAVKALLEVADGHDPYATRRTGELRYSTFAAEYMQRHARKFKKTWRKDEGILNKDVLPKIGGVFLAEITKPHITEILNAIVDRGAPVQANRAHAVLFKTFSFAVALGHIPNNPMKGLPKPSKEVRRDRVLNRFEIVRFWRRLPKARMSERHRNILRLCLLTGQRVSEVAGMRKDELDLRDRLWVIPKERVKNGIEHQVPLSPQAVAVIRRQIKQVSPNDQSVFSGATPLDVPVSGGSVSTSLKANRSLLECPGATPHDLRRTALTNIVALGFDRTTAAKVANHVSDDRSVTGGYDKHDYAVRKRDALTAWADRIDELVKGRQEYGTEDLEDDQTTEKETL